MRREGVKVERREKDGGRASTHTTQTSEKEFNFFNNLYFIHIAPVTENVAQI